MSHLKLPPYHKAHRRIYAGSSNTMSMINLTSLQQTAPNFEVSTMTTSNNNIPEGFVTMENQVDKMIYIV